MNDFKTFIDRNDLEKINDFCRAGFYSDRAMLVMEAELTRTYRPKPYPVSLYEDTDLTKYLKANKKGFGEAMNPETLAKELENPNSRIYILEYRKRIISSVTVWDEDEETVETENIFTIPKYRGLGFARCILMTALTEAKKRGKKKARLTVYSTDTAAIKMYRQLGFKVVKVLQEFKHE